MSKKQPVRGRPKADPLTTFTCRHVVNISEEMEAAARAYADANGIVRLTDGLRALLIKSLRNEGYLK